MGELVESALGGGDGGGYVSASSWMRDVGRGVRVTGGKKK